MGNCMGRKREVLSVKMRLKMRLTIKLKMRTPLSSCPFYSLRIQGLYEGQITELESTQQHWTEVHSKNDVEAESIGEENCKYFHEVLVKHPDWSAFFSRFEDLEVGRKIGEGGQAEIFLATIFGTFQKLVATVFKRNVSLKDLEQQWPREMISQEFAAKSLTWTPFENVQGGVFIRNGVHRNRFAFVLREEWCDLRALIDQRVLELLHDNEHGSPFSDVKDVYNILQGVAFNMMKLHKVGVVHRDIKASNVLLSKRYHPSLMDFECALGSMGIGFWRALEILEQVQRRVPSHEMVITKKADIYSFGMLCYEVITGCIPFEGHPQNDYSIVCRRERPKLPDDLHFVLKNTIRNCWQHDPQ